MVITACTIMNLDRETTMKQSFGKSQPLENHQENNFFIIAFDLNIAKSLKDITINPENIHTNCLCSDHNHPSKRERAA